MDQLRFLVFFVYGLAFFGMGITMALESGRSPALAQARVLLPLAAFGLIHGTHEWMEAYLLQAKALGTALPAWLPWLRLGFLIASFISLFWYGVQMLLLVSPDRPGNHTLRFSIFGFYALFIIGSTVGAYSASPLPLLPLLDGLGRYLLAVPAAMLAALALRSQAKEMFQNKRTLLGRSLVIASFWFAIYSVTQFFVQPIDMFPARYINEDAFLANTGFPIQLIRTIMAVMITYGLVRATQYMEEERKNELFSAQQSQLKALEQRESLRRELLRHIVEAQEDERARIARELHDDISQTLTAFTLELATLRELAKRKPQIKNIVDRLQELSRQMSQGLYSLVHDLRPAQLDDLGLVPAIQSLLNSECCPKGMAVSFEVNGDRKRLDSLIETVLFRVTQEALTNVTRHAGTNKATVCLDYGPEAVTLGVLDSGKGFDPNEPLRPPRGWGLEGMRERVEAVGGRLILHSAPGRGTTVQAVIPLKHARMPEDNYSACI
jgi:signal transduction histidine kinase